MVKNIPRFSATLFLLFLFSAGSAVCQSAQVGYPLIRALDSRDPLFRQLTQDVALFHRAYAAGSELPPLIFFRYEIASEDDLYSIAARTNLGVEAISTVNGT